MWFFLMPFVTAIILSKDETIYFSMIVLESKKEENEIIDYTTVSIMGE
jgi:TRAP-type mannitol/chloroaromatic compound transport system permease small subunit